MTLDDKISTDTLSKTRLRLWLRLLKLTRSIEAELRRRLRDQHGTTLPRFDVMAALARHPEGLKMSELSTFLRVSNGNVTGIAFPVKIHAVWEMKPAALLVADAWRHRRKGFTKAIRLDFLRGQGRCQWAGFAA